MANPPPTMPRPTPVRPVPPPMNSPAYEPPPAPAPPGPKKWRVGFGRIVPWFLAAFLCGLVIQVFLAGYGLGELGNQGMAAHLEWAHVIEIFPLLIAIFGFLGMDKWAGWGGVGLFVMFQAQYALLAATDPILRALHPTNGVLIVLLTLGLLLHRPMWAAKPKPTAE